MTADQPKTDEPQDRARDPLAGWSWRLVAAVLAATIGGVLHVLAVLETTVGSGDWMPILASALLCGAVWGIAGRKPATAGSVAAPSRAKPRPDDSGHRPPSPAPLPGAAPQGIITDLTGFEEFRRIVSSHIDRITETTDAAAFDILGDLRSVEEQVNALIGHFQTTGADQSVGDVLRNTEDKAKANAQKISAFIQDEEKQNNAAEACVTQVRADMEALNKHLSGIQGIAHSTNMLSINAAIEATRAGVHGAGFNVIASEVRTLSMQSNDLAQSIQDGLSRLESSLEGTFQEIIFDHMKAERRMLESMSRENADLVAMLKGLVTQQRAILQEAEDDGRRLAPSIVNLIGSIQFQDITRQQLQNVNKGVEAVEELLTAMAAALADPDQAQAYSPRLHAVLDSMFHSYVMDAERASHGGAHTSPEAAPAIELF